MASTPPDAATSLPSQDAPVRPPKLSYKKPKLAPVTVKDGEDAVEDFLLDADGSAESSSALQASSPGGTRAAGGGGEGGVLVAPGVAGGVMSVTPAAAALPQAGDSRDTAACV